MVPVINASGDVTGVEATHLMVNFEPLVEVRQQSGNTYARKFTGIVKLTIR